MRYLAPNASHSAVSSTTSSDSSFLSLPSCHHCSRGTVFDERTKLTVYHFAISHPHSGTGTGTVMQLIGILRDNPLFPTNRNMVMAELASRSLCVVCTRMANEMCLSGLLPSGC